MTLTRKIVRNAAIGVGVVDSCEALGVFHKPGVAAAVWRRQPLPAFQQWLDGVDAAKLPACRFVARPAAIRDAAMAVCDQSGLPEGPERTRLVEDIAALSHIFSRLLDAPVLRVRLDVISDNACSRFHIDNVVARLVCTYRGHGTQYGISVDGGEPERVFSVPTGAPILLRGTRWPDPPESGLLHRSPPIAGTGETRLVLVLDPIADDGDPARA